MVATAAAAAGRNDVMFGGIAAELETLVQHEKNKFVHAFAAESLRRLSSIDGAAVEVTEAWARFEASERWRPPQMQLDDRFISVPSEELFVESGRGTPGQG